MKLDIKNLSESELTEALEKYPHSSFPDLHEEIDAELRNRDIALNTKSEDQDNLD